MKGSHGTQGCRCLGNLIMPAQLSSVHGCAGVTVIGEVNQLTTHVMNVLWLLGTFTFAIVIGIIGEDVTNTIMVRAKYLAQPSHVTYCHFCHESTPKCLDEEG